MASGVKYDRQFRVTPTVLAGAYTLGRQLCSGIEISGLVLPPNQTASIKSISIICTTAVANFAPTLDLVFFKRAVTNAAGPNVVSTVTNADFAAHGTFVERLNMVTQAAQIGGSAYIVTIHPNNLTVNADTGQNIFLLPIVQAGSALTPAAADALTFVIDFEIL